VIGIGALLVFALQKEIAGLKPFRTITVKALEVPFYARRRCGAG